MADRVVLHIGLDKTGTTAIQLACNASREQLAAESICYPLSPVFGSHHLDFAREFGFSWLDNGARPAVPERGGVYTAVAGTEARCVVLSSEHFVYYRRPGCIAELRAWLDRFLPGARVEVVLFLRNQVDWLTSCYAEAIKWGLREDLDSYVKGFMRRMQFDLVVGEWAEQFGAAAMRLVLYDAFRHDVMTPFFGIIGASAETLALARERMPTFVNQTIPDLILEAVRGMRHDLSPDELHRFLVQKVALNADLASRVPTKGEIWPLPQHLIDRVGELDAVNRRLRNQYAILGGPIAELEPRVRVHEERLAPADAGALDDLRGSLQELLAEFSCQERAKQEAAGER